VTRPRATTFSDAEDQWAEPPEELDDEQRDDDFDEPEPEPEPRYD